MAWKSLQLTTIVIPTVLDWISMDRD